MSNLLISSLIANVLLILASLFAISEVRHRFGFNEEDAFYTDRRLKLRLLGTLIIAVVAVMFFWGINCLTREPIRFLCFWGVWISLLFSLTLLAFYDLEETQKFYRATHDQIVSDMVANIAEVSNHKEIHL